MDDRAKIRQPFSTGQHSKREIGRLVGRWKRTGSRNTTATAVTTNTQRYSGGYQESSNLYKLGARYYDATTGRFTQFDPAGQETNPYGYAGCNPINVSDPTGLSAGGCIGAGLALFGGALGLIVGIVAAPTTLGATAIAIPTSIALIGGGLGFASDCQNAI